MNDEHSIRVQQGVQGSVLITGSHNLVLLAAQEARQRDQDPARMLRIAALLAAPVHDPRHPDRPPQPLDLRTEWRRLEQAVRKTGAPILLARLTPPTLETLRRELSLRLAEQGLFPHVLHFSGHAWEKGLLLEDDYGQTCRVTAAQLLQALKLPRPLELVVLNACETAAEAHSVVQVLLDHGLARAVVGHPLPVADDEAIAFARTLYADLTDGFPLGEAVERAQGSITGHEVVLLGDRTLRFTGLTRGEPLVRDARPRGNLPPGLGVGFFGRGEALVRLARHLDRPPCVVLISGPEGIGKSRLALEAAHRNGWRFPDGVAYAEAPREPPHATAAALLNRLADALSIAVPADGGGGERAPGGGPGPSLRPQEQVLRALLTYAHTTATLFVLDNLESLPPAELKVLADFLARLGGRSAAIATLRPSLPRLEEIEPAASIPLHEGLSEAAAVGYALALARAKEVPLTEEDAEEIARATAGHPLLIAGIVAHARRRDRQALLAEVRRHEGDFAAQVEAVYAWSAKRLGKAGRRAWQVLPLFPAGWAPEAPLQALAGAAGIEALRRAAVADFDPRLQGWRWHPTAAEYAARRWPLGWPLSRLLGRRARRKRLVATLPAWTRWLEGLRREGGKTARARLEAALPNLETLIAVVGGHGRTPLRPFLRALDRVLPPPDRTLSLRAVQEPLYRALAALAPDEAARARALGMLGNALSALGRREEALAATQEAVAIRRKLAQTHPDAFLPDLASSLNNLGKMLSDLGRREEALEAAQEAVALYRGLARVHPEAFLPDLAMSLNNLGSDLSALGRREEALEAMEEAVRLYRGLAQAHPDAFRPDLARSLGAYGTVLQSLGRHAGAAWAFAEGVRQLAPLFHALPHAFADLIASLLRDYLQACEAAGREPDRGLVEPLLEVFRRLGEGAWPDDQSSGGNP